MGNEINRRDFLKAAGAGIVGAAGLGSLAGCGNGPAKENAEGGRMEYRTAPDGGKVSLLGYGCMRFSTNGAKIDLAKAEKEVMTAIDAGVNYFDTASAT